VQWRPSGEALIHRFKVGYEKKAKGKPVLVFTLREMKRLKARDVEESLDRVFGPEKYARPHVRWSAWYVVVGPMLYLWADSAGWVHVCWSFVC
jgi:hypothetical protein